MVLVTNRQTKKQQVVEPVEEEEEDDLPQLSKEDKELIKQNWNFYQNNRAGDMI